MKLITKLKSLLGKAPAAPGYDRENLRPVIRASICTGEQSVGCLLVDDNDIALLEYIALADQPPFNQGFMVQIGVIGINGIERDIDFFPDAGKLDILPPTGNRGYINHVGKTFNSF